LFAAPSFGQIQFKHNLPTNKESKVKGKRKAKRKANEKAGVPENVNLPDSSQVKVQKGDSTRRKQRKDAAVQKGKEVGQQKALETEEGQQASQLKNQVEQQTGDLGELNELPKDKEKGKDFKQKKKDELKQLPENQASKLKEVQELQNQQNPLEQNKSYVDNFRDKEYLKQLARNRSKNVATQQFAQHTSELKTAQDQMSLLKKKYASVPNSSDLSTATKLSSLKGKPFKERFFLGGTLQLLVGDPTSIDFSPLAGYKLNKRWSAGVGGTYRISFGSDKSKYTNHIDQGVYGYRVFSEYLFFKGFFVHGEFESMNKKLENQLSDQPKRIWVNGLMAGLGKEYRFAKKVKGNVMVLYNFLHSEDSPYDKPFVIRFSFMMDKW